MGVPEDIRINYCLILHELQDRIPGKIEIGKPHPDQSIIGFFFGAERYGIRPWKFSAGTIDREFLIKNKMIGSVLCPWIKYADAFAGTILLEAIVIQRFKLLVCKYRFTGIKQPQRIEWEN